VKPLYQVKTLGSGNISFRKRRKIYFLDPFTFHLIRAWTSGLGDPWKSAQAVLADPQRKAAIVEQAVAAHLLRSGWEVLFWRSTAEIDFICMKERKPLWYLESKYQPVITSGDKKALKKAGGGIILSRDTLRMDRENHLVIIPVSYFLAALEWQTP
jgi:predicted AAA+ superfamily ATPase